MYLTCRATTSCVVERYARLRLPPIYTAEAYMPDYPAAFGEPLLAARQRNRAEDPRAAPRGVLPSPVHCQGGRRAAAALLGTEHAHPGTAQICCRATSSSSRR